MGVDVIKPVFNMEHKYRGTMLIREKWTRGYGNPSALKWLVKFTDCSGTVYGTGTGVYG